MPHSPAFIPPLLPTLAAQPPEGPDWIHEIKHDGFRTLLVIDGGNVRAFTRNGHDWTTRYAPILKACVALRCRTAILDGEVVVENERGASDFGLLSTAIAREPHRLVFYAFDLLALDGEDLRRRELIARRALLAMLIASEPSQCLRYSEDIQGDGEAFFKAAVSHGLEGIVSKERRSAYRSGRSKAWLKTKNMVEGEFVLLGTEKDKDGKHLAHLARRSCYAGVALLTLPSIDRQAIERMTRHTSVPSSLAPRRKAAVWLQPAISVRVRHLAGGGLLRHATVKSIVAS